ncbi:EAL and GGDEF domain-containing protein [Azospira restricta]|uniref:EAL domain-containing protein n=1 Tax=Azospira restricta TaxID=404405 RepID=A0A974PXY5_9RHOO|nr:EAL domain-containing protein [Azospira restricta]QRJ63198.1 EAL domain-containing protein [Azospira restricta]
MNTPGQAQDVTPAADDGALLREILDCAEPIVYRADLAGDAYDYVSASGERALGAPLAELRRRGLAVLRERMPAADYARVSAHFQALAAAAPGRQTRTRVDYRLQLPDGRLAWFSDACTVTADADGRATAVFGIATDVSEHKRTEASLQESAHLLADFFAQSLDGCFVLRFAAPLPAQGAAAWLDGLRFSRVSDTFAAQCGTTAAALAGAGPDALPVRDAAAWRQALADCLAAKHRVAVLEFAPRAEAPAWVEMQLLADLDGDGRALGVFGMQRDISQRVAQERALRESEAKYSGIMRAAQVGIFMLQDARFVYVNPRLANYFGYSEEELLAMGPLDVVAPEQHDWLREQMRRRAAGEPGFPYELTGVRKDGSRFPMAIMGVPATFSGEPASVGTVFDLTAQRLVEDQIVESRNRYRALFESAQDAIIVIDGAAGTIVEANVAAEILFRRPREQLLRLPSADIFPPDRRARHEVELRRHITAGGEAPEEMRIRNADGEDVPVEVSTSVVENGGRKQLQAIFRDISARRRAEEGLRLAQRVFDVGEEVILITDAERRIITVNPAFTRVTGFSREEAVGQTPGFLSSGRQPPEFYAAMWAAIERDGVWQGELWNRRKNGEVFPAWLTISAYRDSEGKVINYIGISSDISERHAAEARIRQLAYYDPLTRLPNRTLLQDRVDQVLAQTRREGTLAALLFIDLDHFKTINDSLGHFTGDQLLCAVAQRMSECVRKTDTVARLGGDEFVVVCSETSIEGTAGVARKILKAVSQSFQTDGHQLTVTPSVGISLFPQDGDDFETLLKHADTAMYRAKESGRNAYQFFAREMNEAAFERLMLENSLRVALERRELVLHYQPQVDLASGRIIGAEALIRWQHPQLGMVSPGRFVPIAEASGLIVPIGAWVLKEACRQAAEWRAAGLPPISVAVNISSAQFRQQRFDEAVAGVLQLTGLPAEHLELELTESIVMEDAEATVQALRKLSVMGVQLAIDDFGTGYSSLSYLKRFPIDKLKIDRSFVRDIVTDADDWAIASTVISMGQSLRLQVIAEGVETAEQLDMLRRQGCHAVQGYHFSRPVPAGDFVGLLARQPFVAAR